MQTEQVPTKEVRARGSPRSLARPHAFLLGTKSRGATGQPWVLLLGWKLKLRRIFAFGVAILRFSPGQRGSGLLSAPRAPRYLLPASLSRSFLQCAAAGVSPASPRCCIHYQITAFVWMLSITAIRHSLFYPECLLL